MRVSAMEVVCAAAATSAAWLITGDPLAAVATAALAVGFKLLNTGDGLVVLFLAFCYQWMQVAIGVFYGPLTGRELLTTVQCDYQPMVLMGLGCIVALACGLRVGIYLVRRTPERVTDRPQAVMTFPALVTAYAFAFVAEPVTNRIAMTYPAWRQVLITVAVAHLAILFILMRRLVIPKLRWQALLVVVGLEVARGLTGYFAGFKEPLILITIVLLEVFDRRRFAHWVALGTVVCVMVLVSLMWINVRGTLRGEMVEVEALSNSQTARFNRMSDLGEQFFSGDIVDMRTAADRLVDRMWAVYYPALAIERVPKTLPHTNGSLMSAAITHVLTPRVFFPDKPNVVSDSELVRKYSGIWVAGDQENTTIAFGYVGESYIDYGVPWMFLPSLLFGLLMGIAYAWLVRHLRHMELMIATVNVVFWMALYMFERSWANTLGNAVGLLVYLAVPIALVDDFLLVRYVQRRRDAQLSEYA